MKQLNYIKGKDGEEIAKNYLNNKGCIHLESNYKNKLGEIDLIVVDNNTLVFIVGKAAILAGQIGDIQIPRILFDERTHNMYSIKNVFNENFPFPTFQSAVLKNQKAVSVHGTFLENDIQANNYVAFGFNIVEMESGPYVTALVEKFKNNNNFPQNGQYDLDGLPFDFGILNYASDNPLTKNLGEGSMALKGVEPTYLSLLSVLQRIIDLELNSN